MVKVEEEFSYVCPKCEGRFRTARDRNLHYHEEHFCKDCPDHPLC